MKNLIHRKTLQLRICKKCFTILELIQYDESAKDVFPKCMPFASIFINLQIVIGLNSIRHILQNLGILLLQPQDVDMTLP